MNKLSNKDQKLFRKATDEFKESINEEISSCLILGDLDRFDRLVSAVHTHLDHELMEALRNKGLGKEIEALAEKAGNIEAQKTRSA